MTTAAKISVTLLDDDDFPTSFQVLSKSFGHDAPLIDIYFPNHDTPSGQARGSARLAAWKQGSEDSTFLKAVLKSGQDGQERIIGLAVWTYMKEPPPADIEKVENVEEVWPDVDDREYMARLWRDYVVPRTKSIEDSAGKGIFVLELLAIHPEYQRLGAGAALVKWGTKAADDKGVKAVVEGTPVARRLYEQCGLVAEIEEMRFDVGEKFVGRRKPNLIFLSREPKS
ncbi:hypothetical protein K505DRAFT_407495 [Melanomma pulvis-pyrius CBS 109.77]|uniref:N-acetyltransferase domain-containing protein n=1 Tax=Melanomma pulvis-pyrius CBS 109.77 TaxID=1314802 RepID=A0A6A6XEL6_9PLEO|nr:hypothetical protein K505DRAFT_407495 [Melanomma pulvis-pyrius CBS 109.77]